MKDTKDRNRRQKELLPKQKKLHGKSGMTTWVPKKKITYTRLQKPEQSRRRIQHTFNSKSKGWESNCRGDRKQRQMERVLLRVTECRKSDRTATNSRKSMWTSGSIHKRRSGKGSKGDENG